MSIERYMEIAKKLKNTIDTPVPVTPTKQECVEAEQMVSDLVAMRGQEIGINPDELEGAIGLAQDYFRQLVRAKP